MKQFILGSICTAIIIALTSGTTFHDLEPTLMRIMAGKAEADKMRAGRAAVRFCYLMDYDIEFKNKEHAQTEIDRCIEKYKPIIISRLENE